MYIVYLGQSIKAVNLSNSVLGGVSGGKKDEGKKAEKYQEFFHSRNKGAEVINDLSFCSPTVQDKRVKELIW